MTTLESVEDELRRETKRIYDGIQDARLELSDGTNGWIGYDTSFNNSPKGALFLRGQKGLNSGQLGIAVYFAGMYEVFAEESYRQDVRETIDFLIEEDIEELTRGLPLGGADGLGAVVYGLSVVAELTGDRRYEDRGREFVRSLTDEEIEENELLDLILGTAGTIAGFLRFYEQTGDEVALEKAVRCGEDLLENRYEERGYRVWDTHMNPTLEKFSTGISHGSAGIGYSLYRLYAHTGREEFRDAADEAIEYENVFYSEYENNWKSNWSSVVQYPLWWAYGAPGIGLARLGSLEYRESDTLKRDVERVKALEPQLDDHDSILRGTFSQVELFAELGRAYDDEYHERAEQLAVRAIERKRRLDGYQVVGGGTDGITNPALFLGTAGIGYTLLRLLETEELPCVFRFE